MVMSCVRWALRTCTFIRSTLFHLSYLVRDSGTLRSRTAKKIHDKEIENEQKGKGADGLFRSELNEI